MQGVHVGKDDVDVDAGGQDIMFGCASEETELRRASHLTATRLRKELTDVRKNGGLWWLRPDGKTSRNGHNFVELTRALNS